MKRQVSTGHVFTPGSSRLDLSAVPGMSKGGLLAVLDVTTGGIVYAVASPGLGASFAGLVLTLAAPMTGMASGDTLAIIFDDGALAAQDSSVQTLATTFGLPADAAATSDAGPFGVVALLKRALGYLGALAGAVAAGRVQTLDANGAAFGAAVAMTAGTSYPTSRSVGVVCTTAGNLTFTLSGGGTLTLPVSPGWQTFPLAATAFAYPSAGAAAGSVFTLS